MAAGLGFKTFTTGEVLTAADVNGYLMQGILVFANAAARSSAITSPQEGQYSFLKDTNALEYYDGAAWVGAPVGDITSVTAGTGISGGGSSGDVTITNSMATAIDAKGDLIAGTADNTFSRLAVGNSGETLVADSSTSTGLRYTGGTVQSNPILNSALQIWQRGTSNVTTAYAYTADRWQKNVATHYGVSRATTSDTTNLPFIQYCARVQRTAGSTSTTVMEFVQSVETANSIPFIGKTVTMSFYARAGANYSAASNTLSAALYTGTSTDGNLLQGPWATAATPILEAATLTTTWQRFSYTGTISASATQIAPLFSATPTGTAGANDYFEVTGVQIDIGSVPLPFRTYAGTLAGELAACQRYYYLEASGDEKTLGGVGYYSSATEYSFAVRFPVQMRTTPTLDYVSGTDYYRAAAVGYSDPFNTLTILRATPVSTFIINATQVSGTSGDAKSTFTNNPASYVAFSAEL